MTAINETFKEKYIAGLGLRPNLSSFYFLLENYHLYIKEQTQELKSILETEKFFIFDLDNYNNNDDEYRLCRDYEELIMQLDYQFNCSRRYYLSDSLKELLIQYKELNFSDAELYDILMNIAAEKLSTIIVPSAVENKGISVLLLIINFCFDTSFLKGKMKKAGDSLLKITFESIKHCY